MSAAGVTDWSVACNGPGCWCVVWASSLGLYAQESPRELREALKERGWTTGVPEGAMNRVLDFCPEHKPGKEGANP